ncbi:MAG: DUF2283 domain-containing protein [Melioribacteraceae bacterium]|nr:DUF2283 domain-containing protein [Melioribacteraceae bacterium]
MKLEYDSKRDLFYIRFSSKSEKVARTKTIVPGVYADFNDNDRLLGIELLDASEFIDKKLELDIDQLKQIA